MFSFFRRKKATEPAPDAAVSPAPAAKAEAIAAAEPVALPEAQPAPKFIAGGAGLFSAAADPVPQAEPPVAEAQTAEPEPIESPSRTGWVDRLVEYAARAQPLAVYFIGVGEQLQDLQTFQAREFAQALVS
jgi:hypothetical protein